MAALASLSAPQARCAWLAGAILGEGPVYVDAQRALYFVDIKGQRLHRLFAAR